jgi:outer membrane receptor protein involved in Fe transport
VLFKLEQEQLPHRCDATAWSRHSCRRRFSNLGVFVDDEGSIRAGFVVTLDCVPGLTLGSAQKTNFAPRVGFAYRVTPTLVVRGGYGPAYGATRNL